MPALKGKDYGKSKMKYPDYAETSSGLQYKVVSERMVTVSFSFLLVHFDQFYKFTTENMQDLRAGNGKMPKPGDIVVVCQPFCTSLLMFSCK